MSQILRNFISNALKFTEQGEVRVSAQLSPDGRTVVFSVADTGIGIAPEHQDIIFQEFAQLENPLQRKVRGTGLGLPLSKKLAELLGGSVSVESQPGLGSTFSATIPLVYAPAQPFSDVVLAPDSIDSAPAGAGDRGRNRTAAALREVSARHRLPAGAGAQPARGAGAAGNDPPGRHHSGYPAAGRGWLGPAGGPEGDPRKRAKFRCW